MCGRLAGLAGGIVAASLVTTIWRPTGLLAAVLAVLCLALAFGRPVGYIAVSAALAAAIVFLIDINAAAGGATMGDRLLRS